MQETWVRFLGWEDRLEKEMAIHSSILAWKIPWTEEAGGLQSMGWQRVGHDWATTHARTHHRWTNVGGSRLYSVATTDQSLEIESRTGVTRGQGWGDGALLFCGSGQYHQGNICQSADCLVLRLLNLNLMLILLGYRAFYHRLKLIYNQDNEATHYQNFSDQPLGFLNLLWFPDST